MKNLSSGESFLCPICGSMPVERLVEINGDRAAGSAVVAYRCTANDHVFFVRETYAKRQRGLKGESRITAQQ